MTTYYRIDGQEFTFQADIDYEAQEISGYKISVDSGEEVYTGTVCFDYQKSPEEFQQAVDSFVRIIKAELEPFRIQMS